MKDSSRSAARITAAARWTGDLAIAGNVEITGSFLGQLQVDGELAVRAGATIEGPVQARALIFEEGAQMRGPLAIGSNDGASSKSKKGAPLWPSWRSSS